jgi:AcrR family transcriptional regulator
MARKQGSHSDITGPKVREAALKLIAQHGYAAVSMRQIAAEVGVQAGALYNYTADKQSLLFDIVLDHMEELSAALKKVDLSGSPWSALEAFIRFHIVFHVPRVEQVFISYMELRNLDPDNFAVIEGRRRDYEQVLAGILKAGKESGDFTITDPRITSIALIGMLTAIPQWYREGGRLPLSEIEEIYWGIVRRSVTT